jgi:hypothetical protein
MQNIGRTQIPSTLLGKYLQLYLSIGKNEYNHETLESDFDSMLVQTIRNNTYYCAKIFGSSVSDARFKSLIYKDVIPKNKEEVLIQNLKLTFQKIHESTSTFFLLTSEIQDLIRFVYRDVLSTNKMQYRKIEKQTKNIDLLSGKFTTTREQLEQLIALYQETIKRNEYEISNIITNFYIDFLNIKPFYDKNEEIGLLLLYILLLSNGYEVYHYISLFEKIYHRKDVWDKLVIQSSFNWEVGYAQVLPLHEFLIEQTIASYTLLNDIVRDYNFDKQLNKSDNVENTINKLDEIFTKDDIRIIHPYISDSTINRTLKRMRDEGKIRPLGKGRSAKWMKLYKSNNKFKFEQLDLKI